MRTTHPPAVAFQRKRGECRNPRAEERASGERDARLAKGRTEAISADCVEKLDCCRVPGLVILMSFFNLVGREGSFRGGG